MSSAAQNPERVVARLRPHARVLFWPCLAVIALAFGMGYYTGAFPEPWQNLTVLAVGALLILLLWFLPLLSWLGKRYVITSRRIVLRHGCFVRIRQELLHSRGYDIVVRKNAMQSLFGSGDVRINTGLEHPVVLRDVPGADLVQSVLHDLMERSLNPIAARRQAESAGAPDETRVWGVR
jgi:membrane protein YdbS with pleckstrin-like domain